MNSVTQRPDPSGWPTNDLPVSIGEPGREALEKAFTRGLMPLARSWRQALDHELSALDLSGSTGWALMIIDQLGNEVRQIDLASGLNINAGSVVRLVDALVHAGYVDRVFDPADRRVRRVALTEAGRDLVCKVESAMASFRRDLFAGLADEDLGAALRVARQIDRSLEAGRRL